VRVAKALCQRRIRSTVREFDWLSLPSHRLQGVHHASSQEGSGFSRSHCVSRFVRRVFFAAKITFRAKTSNTDGDGLKFGYSTFPLFSLSI
jgi:hypothetical protein